MDLEELEKEYANKPKPKPYTPSTPSMPLTGQSKQLSSYDKGALEQMQEWEDYMVWGVRAFNRLYSGD